MDLKKYAKRIQFYVQFSPITFNGVITGLALYFCFWFLNNNTGKEVEQSSSFLPFLKLMGNTALLFFCALIAFSFLSALFCWLFAVYLSKKKNKILQFQFQSSDKLGKNINLNAELEQARRPFLGFIKSKLVYDNFQLTEKIILEGNSKKQKSFWRKGVKTSSRLHLPDIKTYTLKGSFVFFEDMLQLFSFPIYQNQKGNFFQAPQYFNIQQPNAQPRETENADIKIDESRRIPGDYLNYKNFESGDDIRRIVWKVYAKNRELVVRTPEQKDLYASHIYFYASFFATVPDLLQNSVFGKEMLNYFKNSIWSIYTALAQKEEPIKFYPEQEFHLDHQENKSIFVQNCISNSIWQHEKTLNDYFNIATGSVLCISSFSDPDDVLEIVEKCNAATIIYYIKLSKAFRHFVALSWFAKLFFQSSDNRLKKTRSLWLFHPYRIQLQKREQIIEKILENSNATIGKL